MILLFLSAASREWRRVEAIAGALDLTGKVHLTQRWWEPSAQGTPYGWSGLDKHNDHQTQVLLASSNMNAIDRANIVWCLWPDTDGRSTCEAEFGYALAKHKPVIVTGERASESNWTSHATYRESSDEMGLIELLRLVTK